MSRQIMREVARRRALLTKVTKSIATIEQVLVDPLFLPMLKSANFNETNLAALTEKLESLKVEYVQVRDPLLKMYEGF